MKARNRRISGYLISGYLISGNLISGYLISGNLISGYLISGNLISGYLISGYLISGNLISGNLISGYLISGNLISILQLSSISYREPGFHNPKSTPILESRIFPYNIESLRETYKPGTVVFTQRPQPFVVFLQRAWT